MIRFFENYSLRKHTTFGIEAKAKFFFEFTESSDLIEMIQANASFQEVNKLIIGGGSNYLFTQDFDGIVLHPNIPGIRILQDDGRYVSVEAGAGVVWDDFVDYCVNEGLGGVENLSLIPGCVGAAPVQNIGAYGVEAKDVIERVNVVDLKTAERYSMHHTECKFGYRNSIFKHELKDKVIVSSVEFRLERQNTVNLAYGRLKDEVSKYGDPTIKNVRKAVVAIRESKLPDPLEMGNAGSFFMNPVVEESHVNDLLQNYPDMPYYDVDGVRKKLAAGWLIEQCGFKGCRKGDAGVHQDQALVLVNYGKAGGQEILDLSEEIRTAVDKKFGVILQREVIVV
ncbi:UDP-N-acetylmuramate dehydrogenase [Puteibacter caeruleilacunae]|nr:UDP-N-acetylmuramate dehydrogenase [Puteibacter caeruleilacunae]